MNHAALVTSLLALAAFWPDGSESHPHRGVLPALDGPPALPELTADEVARLRAGEQVLRQHERDAGGRGIAIQDINAPAEVVWDRLFDFDAYGRMVPNVSSATAYENQGEHMKVKFTLKRFGMEVVYFLDYLVRPHEGWVTWTLDYDKKSALYESVGAWVVEPRGNRTDAVRVYHFHDVVVGTWAPSFVARALRTEGLKASTSWLKAEAERVYKKGR